MVDKYDNKEVTKRISDLLKDRGISKYRLSEETGVKETTLSAYFNRDSKWGVDTLAAIAEYFHVTIDWLVTGNEADEQAKYKPSELKRLQNEIKKVEDEKKALQKRLDHIVGIAK